MLGFLPEDPADTGLSAASLATYYAILPQGCADWRKAVGLSRSQAIAETVARLYHDHEVVEFKQRPAPFRWTKLVPASTLAVEAHALVVYRPIVRGRRKP